MRVVLISTYDLGRQPFGLASPAAWLRAEGAEVACRDLSVEALDEDVLHGAGLVAFHLPMHAATRLAARRVPQIRELAPRVPVCCYGLYAAMNERYLRSLGVDYVIGGEYEAALASLVRRLRDAPAGHLPHQIEPVVTLDRLPFRTPDRRGLPELTRYARLRFDGGERLVGYTEASRGCKHRCRHCPIVPVYDGRFRVVSREVVLEDIRAQVEAGAQHVTFGDPDFWNGIGHAIPIVEALHREHPHLSYDVTIKIEHLLRHRAHLAALRRTGCLFVTSAVESVDDRVLERLDKGHTRADFIEAAALCRNAGLVLHPTFVPFTPWTSLEGYRDLLSTIPELDLVDHVAPVQLAIRLLLPAGSRLLELEEIARLAGPFDEAALVHRWVHADPAVDRLQSRLEALVREEGTLGSSRKRVFARVWTIAEEAAAAARPALSPHGPHRDDLLDALAVGGSREPPRPLPESVLVESRAPVPYLTEPWYC